MLTSGTLTQLLPHYSQSNLPHPQFTPTSLYPIFTPTPVSMPHYTPYLPQSQFTQPTSLELYPSLPQPKFTPTSLYPIFTTTPSLPLPNYIQPLSQPLPCTRHLSTPTNPFPTLYIYYSILYHNIYL